MTDAAGSSQPDYYAVLGLDAAAAAAISADDIKSAYRTAAKRAHPDAGGSAEAMERVNEAHRVLSDPADRRQYDQRRLAPEPEAQHRSGDPGPDASPHTHPHDQSHRPDHDPAATARHTGAADPAAFHRLRRSQARRNALQIFRRSAFSAVAAIVIGGYLLGASAGPNAFFIPQPITRALIAAATFIPVYGMILSIIFLVSPQIRLDLFDLVQYWRRRGPHPHLDRPGIITLGALAVMIVPLATIWAGIVLYIFARH
jgi:hypothetical protein